MWDRKETSILLGYSLLDLSTGLAVSSDKNTKIFARASFLYTSYSILRHNTEELSRDLDYKKTNLKT